MPESNNCFWHLSAVANFTTRHGFCSILGKNTAFCVYSVHVKYWCATNSNLAYFIELTTALECQEQLLMSSISNLGGRESLEIAVIPFQMTAGNVCIYFSSSWSLCCHLWYSEDFHPHRNGWQTLFRQNSSRNLFRAQSHGTFHTADTKEPLEYQVIVVNKKL